MSTTRDKYPVGQHVFLVTSPWPERRGCDGVIAATPPDGSYPTPARWERAVLLQDDPLEQPGDRDRGWSVVLSVKHLCPRSATFERTDNHGTCVACDRPLLANQPDPCIGYLPGVQAACCGHGEPQMAYVLFNNGVSVRPSDEDGRIVFRAASFEGVATPRGDAR